MLGNTWRSGLKPANSFATGHAPWNKNLKGIHLSPATEIKPGVPLVAPVPTGTERTRPDKKGKPRIWVKVSEPNTWRLRAQIVWENAHGKTIPDGHIVHHANRISTDDSEGNLVLMSKSEHMNEHRGEFEQRRRESNAAAQKKRWERARSSKAEE